jgi:hypothetical protein
MFKHSTTSSTCTDLYPTPTPTPTPTPYLAWDVSLFSIGFTIGNVSCDRYGNPAENGEASGEGDDVDMFQPVPLTIETINGATIEQPAETTPGTLLGAKVTPPLSGDDAVLQRYRDKFATKPELYPKKFGKQCITAKLRRACKKGYYENVDKILTWPTVDINGARKGGSGKTALHIVAHKG